MQRLSRDRHVYELNAAHAPAYTVADGETFLVETHDCHAGCFTRQGTWLGARPRANPATGPIAVTGSQPGEALAITIEKVEAADWGFIAGGEEGAPFTVIEMHDGRACYPWGLSLPLDPMIGVLGVAPEGAPVDTATPTDWGGNLDTREIRAGSTIYFPVATLGALLVMGDVHALQGDGECCGTGIECAAEITLTVRRVPEPLWHCPLITRGDLLMLVATADTLDEAAWRAVAEMSGLISKLTGLPNVQARRLLSTAGDIHISQIVNPRKTCRAVISREALGGAWVG